MIDWEEAVLDGIDARQQADAGRWKLGDLARHIVAAYVQENLQGYAK